ncbi:MAG: DUF2339 domain-containing protein [Janthinobacterium lividum]
MVMWAAIVGALLGWIVCEFESYGLLLGAVPGAMVGLVLRGAVRREIAAVTADLRAQVAALATATRDPAPAAFAEPASASEPAVPAARLARVEAGAVDVLPPASPRDPLPIEEPSAAGRAAAAAWERARGWLLGGNTVVRVGLAILFIGLSFLARYAASAGLFPIELRLALVVVVGVALLVTGYRTRLARPGFAAALQGGGIATIYLTVFAAAKWFGLASAAPALAVMVAVCALGAALAMLQASQSLAVTALTGGFAAPVLLASGHGNVALLFGYYTVLNLGILGIARRRAWRALNLLGFAATFGIATLWETGGVAPSDRPAGHGFIVASVLIYVAAAILYARRAPRRLGQVVDTTLLFGPAVAGFGLEAGLLHHQPFGAAFAALGFAALYIALAALNQRRGGPEARILNDALLAIGVGFVTLAVPLALGARWTSAAWALEGAGAFWIGSRQARWLPRAFGLLLQGVAALVFLGTLRLDVPAPPLLGPGFLGAVLIAGALLATAWWLRERPAAAGSRWARGWAEMEAALPRPVALLGFAFWVGAWAIEAARIVPAGTAGRPPAPAFAPSIQPLLVTLAYVVSAWSADAIGRRARWRVATWPGRATIAVLALAFVGTAGSGERVAFTPDWLLWAAVLAIHLRLLFLTDREAEAGPPALLAARVGHVGTAWLGIAMVANAVPLATERSGLAGTGWDDAILPVVLALALVLLTRWATRRLADPAAARWPLTAHAADYGWVAAAPVATLALLVALAVGLASPGDAVPLPYLPLLNPVDLSLALVLGAVLLWRRTVLAAPAPAGSRLLVEPGMLATLGGLAFVLVSTVWLRAAHQLIGVAWDAGALLGSFVVQAGLALLWTALALALMVGAHRRGVRSWWIVGAGLLGVTVAKLLLVDMGNVGGATRIVTFMGVGVLMLVVGYLAPLPPQRVPTPEGAII